MFPRKFSLRRRDTVSLRLTALVAACVIPACLVAGLTFFDAYQQKRSLIDQSMRRTAQALSLIFDAEFSSVRGALQALATSPLLDSGDFAGFHAQAREVLQGFPEADIILADSTGQQLVNSYRNPGDPLPKRNAPDLVRQIFTTGQPVLGDMFRGAVTKRPLVALDVPVKAGNRVIYDLSMTLPANRLAAVLSRHALPSQWNSALLDSDLTVVGCSQGDEDRIGQKPSASLAQHLGEGGSGAFEAPNRNGVATLFAFHRSVETGWITLVSVPLELVTAELQHWLAWTVVGFLAIFAVGGGLALLAATSIARSIQRLVEPALALGRGEMVTVAPQRLEETDAVGQALTTAAELHARRRQERDAAAQALVERTELLQHQYESLRLLNDISALPSSAAQQQLTGALALGLQHLRLDVAIISRINGDKYQILHHVAPVEAGLADNMVFELGETYCSIAVDIDDVVAIAHMAQSPYAGHPCYRKFRLERYIGAPITIGGKLFGTVNFTSPHPADHDFDEGDIEFVGLLARWIAAVLERNAAHQELARSNAELEQFAYVASHDLREPLRQVSNYVTLLERHLSDKFPDGLDDDGRDYMATAKRGAMRMNQLILDLLEYSRLGRGERPLAAVALSQAMAEALGYLATSICDSGARLDAPHDDLPTVLGDYNEMVRLFQNLIGNAVKYRDPARPLTVQVTAEREGRFWKLSVGDNGVGIAPEHFERIFRLFQRLHSQERYEGTGIGLASAKKIIEHLGGRIWLESTPGVGSRFWFTLPAADES